MTPLASLLLLGLGALPHALAQTTLAPATVATDVDNPHFMGYYIAPESTQSLTVSAGAVWATRGSYAAQCEDNDDIASCAIPTACFNSRLSFDTNQVATCPDDSDCATFTIFQTSPFGGPVVTNYACRAAWVAHTVYRQLVETMTSSSSTGTTNTGPGATNTSPPGDSDDDSSSGSSNLGPALGGALGGAAILIILAVVGVIFYRRRKRANAQKHLIPQSEKDAAAAAAIWNTAPGEHQNSTPGTGYPHSYHQSTDLSSGHPSGYSGSTPGGWSTGPDGKFYSTGAVPYGPNAYNQYSQGGPQQQYQPPPSELGTTSERFGNLGPGSGPYANAKQAPGQQLPVELPGSEAAAEVASPPMVASSSPASATTRGSPGGATDTTGTITVGMGAGTLGETIGSPTMGTGMGSMNAVAASRNSERGTPPAQSSSPSSSPPQQSPLQDGGDARI